MLEHGLIIKEAETALETIKMDKPRDGDHIISPPAGKLAVKEGKVMEV